MPYGVKETKDVITAAGDVAAVVYKAQKGARDASGKLDPAKLANGIAAEIMANPQVLDDLKAAADGITDVPKELRDLTFGEIAELIGACGTTAGKVAAAIA